MTTVKEYFENDLNDGKTSVLIIDKYGVPTVQIEWHEMGLTVTDCNTSVAELGFRDDSNEDIDEIIKWYKEN